MKASPIHFSYILCGAPLCGKSNFRIQFINGYYYGKHLQNDSELWCDTYCKQIMIEDRVFLIREYEHGLCNTAQQQQNQEQTQREDENIGTCNNYLICYDTNNAASLDMVPKILTRIYSIRKKHADLNIVICGCKNDLERMVPPLQDIQKRFGAIPVIESSAKLCYQIDETMYLLCRRSLLPEPIENKKQKCLLQ